MYQCYIVTCYTIARCPTEREAVCTRCPTEREVVHTRCPTEREVVHTRCPTEREVVHTRCPTEREVVHTRCPTEREVVHTRCPRERFKGILTPFECVLMPFEWCFIADLHNCLARTTRCHFNVDIHNSST